MSRPSLDDLDRCEHGRHSVDNCLDCPGGWSVGNQFLEDGQRIGTNYAGEPIVVEHARGPRKRESALREWEPICGRHGAKRCPECEDGHA